MEEKSQGGERWTGAIANLTETTANLESLQKILLKKAVFVDEETFSRASLASEQARTIKVLGQRVETLERELDAAISAAAHARTEKRQAEAAQKNTELHAQEVTKELENTTKVFELHMEELRAKQEEISKRDEEIKLLEAIIKTLGAKDSRSSNRSENEIDGHNEVEGAFILCSMYKKVLEEVSTQATGFRQLQQVMNQDNTLHKGYTDRDVNGALVADETNKELRKQRMRLMCGGLI